MSKGGLFSFLLLFIFLSCAKKEEKNIKSEGVFQDGDRFVFMASYDESFAPEKSIRVFAVGHKFDIEDLESEEKFRASYEKFMQFIKPYFSKKYQNVVVFEEHAGLPLIFFGEKGKEARKLSTLFGAVPLVSQKWANAISYYIQTFPEISTMLGRQIFLALTDTMWRIFFNTFSYFAKNYGVWVVSCQDSPYPYISKENEGNISDFVDDLVQSEFFYKATTSDVWNSCFIFSPEGEIVHQTKKVNLVPTEVELLNLSSGKYGELSVFRILGTEIDLCIGISLDAFVPEYIYELDKKGCDVFLQPDANSGAWATTGGLGYWQPLEWLGSTMGSIQQNYYIGCTNPHKALFLTGEKKCEFQKIQIKQKSIKYNVNPMMVGNLFDISFDGQTAITGRDKRAKRDINYVGLLPLDKLTYGEKGEIMFPDGGFIVLGPWTFDLSGYSVEEQIKRAEELQKTLQAGGENEGKYISSIISADITLGD
jgi:hypothetical protein